MLILSLISAASVHRRVNVFHWRKLCFTFVYLSVFFCFSVCLLDYCKSYERILMIFFVWVGGARTTVDSILVANRIMIWTLYYLCCRLASKGIAMLGVTLCVCVCQGPQNLYSRGGKFRWFSVPRLMTWCHRIDLPKSKLNTKFYILCCTGCQKSTKLHRFAPIFKNFPGLNTPGPL